MLRALILAGAMAAPPAAPVQPYTALQDARDAERVAAEQAARQRDVAITNELSRLQAQSQTNQALSDISALRQQPAVPVVRYNPNAPPPKVDLTQFAQIPDAALADSNAKVRAAAQNRK